MWQCRAVANARLVLQLAVRPSAPDAAPPRYPHVRRLERRASVCQHRGARQENGSVGGRLLFTREQYFAPPSYIWGGKPPTPSSISNVGLILGVVPLVLMGHANGLPLCRPISDWL